MEFGKEESFFTSQLISVEPSGFHKIRVINDTNIPLVLGAIGSNVGVVVAGGAVRAACSTNGKTMFSSDDVDLFFKTQQDFDSALRELNNPTAFGYSLNHDFGDVVYNKETTVSHILWYALEGNENVSLKLNLIKPGTVVFNTVEELISQFDFSVNRIVWLNDKEALADADFISDEAKGTLRVKFIHCPISSVTRIAKYVKKGYHCPLKEALKLFMNWDERPDQYRRGVLKLLREEDPSQDNSELAYRLMYRD